jgi:hypothetical protein
VDLKPEKMAAAMKRFRVALFCLIARITQIEGLPGLGTSFCQFGNNQRD